MIEAKATANQEDGRWSRESGWVLLLILGMIGIRMVAASSVPLLASEAYYWLWGQFPALGYFDHPPMVGWMSWLFFGWIKGSELAARSAPILLGAATTWVVYRLGSELFGSRRTGWRIALVLSIVPIFDVGSILLQPDNSLLLFTALTWLWFWRAANRGASLGPWMLTGVVAGLALLSKFHAWVLLPPLYLFLFISAPHRRLLKTPGPWLAIGVALLVLSPNLFWNMHHGWLTYGFQMHRSGLARSQWNYQHPLAYLAGPLLTLSPLVYVAAIAATWKGLRRRAMFLRPEVLLLLLAGAPLTFFFLLLCPFVSISLHWPAVGYFPLIILAVGLMDRGELFGRRYWHAMVATGAGFLVVLHLTPTIARALPDGLALPFFSEEVNMRRLKAELGGWDEMGDLLRQEYQKVASNGPAFIMLPDFHLAAQMSFYTRLPGCVQVSDEDREHGFELWENDGKDSTGATGIVVLPVDKNADETPKLIRKQEKNFRKIGEMFDSLVKGPELAARASGRARADDSDDGVTRRYRIVYGYHYKGEPEI